MSDPFGTGGDTVGNDGGLEQQVDTGGVNAGEMAGGTAWGQGSNVDGVEGPGRNHLLDADDPAEVIEEHGLERLTQEEQAEQRAENERLEALDQADREELERQEAEKNAAREEAHGNGEAFLEREYTSGGETYQEWSLPDGTTITVDAEGNAVSVEWPEGEGPEYVGDVIIDGEPHSVWELPTGTQVVVDARGNTVGTIDDVDIDDIAVDLYILTGDPDDIGEKVFVEMVPDDDHDTQVVDAETGEVYKTYDTGSDVHGINIYRATGGEVAAEQSYTLYNPPGTDYYIVIDQNGQPVDTIPVPEEPEWSLFGIVEYYEDGEVVVDIGAAEVSVDVVGPDGGISVELDLLIAEGTAGVEWNEDGSWDFDSSVEFDAGGASVEAGLGFGQDADGMWHVDVETSMEMQYGVLHLAGGQHFHFQQTPEGSEWNVGWEGTVSGFGLYVERSQDLTVVFDDDGMTTTYEDMIGAGIKGLGGFQVTNETQLRTDGTWDGTEASQGVRGAVVNEHGNEVAGASVGYDTEEGFYSRSESIDTGADYERQYGNDMPAFVGDDAADRGQLDADRFGLGDRVGENEDEADDGTKLLLERVRESRDRVDGRGERIDAELRDNFGDASERRMNVEIGMAATATETDADEPTSERPAASVDRLLDDVTQVPAQRYIGETEKQLDDRARPAGEFDSPADRSPGVRATRDEFIDDVPRDNVVVSGGATMLSDDITSAPVVMSGGSTGAAGDNAGDSPAPGPAPESDPQSSRPELDDEVGLGVAQVETAIPAATELVAPVEPEYVEEVSEPFQALRELDANVDLGPGAPIDDGDELTVHIDG